jgi:Fe2+ transport system protein FeoA
MNKQFNAMGVTSGNIIEVESTKPNEDRVGIKIRGHHLSVSREDAGSISVEMNV